MTIEWMDESSGHTIDTVSPEAVKEFISMGRGTGRIPADVDPSDVGAVLGRYGAVHGDGTVSIAGMLLFSENPRRINRGAYLRIGEFDSDGILRREDIIDGALILAPNRAMSVLFGRYAPPTYEYRGVFRIVSDRYPRDGMGELIVNAVAHMDYGKRQPVSVAVHPDRIEIFNFGCLPEGWTADTLMGKHPSIPRNRTIAEVFHDAGYSESWAQGIRRVVASCGENGNPPPEFRVTPEGLEVTIYCSRP